MFDKRNVTIKYIAGMCGAAFFSTWRAKAREKNLRLGRDGAGQEGGNVYFSKTPLNIRSYSVATKI